MPTRDEYIQYAIAVAERYEIDPKIFVAQINQESGFNQYDQNGNILTSSAGAKGIAQIMPNYHPTADYTDAFASLDYAGKLDRSALDRYGDYPRMLAAYNGGPGVADSGRWPLETVNYVRSILGASPTIYSGTPAVTAPTDTRTVNVGNVRSGNEGSGGGSSSFDGGNDSAVSSGSEINVPKIGITKDISIQGATVLKFGITAIGVIFIIIGMLKIADKIAAPIEKVAKVAGV